MGICETSKIKEQVAGDHKPVPLEDANELSKSICKILTIRAGNKRNSGTGFFMDYKSLKCLITNYHVISNDLMYENIELEISNKKIKLKLDYNYRYIRLFKQPTDITIIEIKDSDGINENIKYLGYDTNYMNGGYSQYKNLDVICVQYPFGDKIACSSGKIKDIINFEFEHNIPTEEGSSGSPIILFNTKKVIGVHKAGVCMNEIKNLGTFIGTIFDEVDKDLSHRIISPNNNILKVSAKKSVITMKEKNDYESRIAVLEKKLENTKIQNILTSSPKIDVKHDHKDWIYTFVMTNRGYIITGSKDSSIKCLNVEGEEDYEEEGKKHYISFTIEKAHEDEIKYILKVNDNEIISCGSEGKIKRWYINCDDKDYHERFKLMETFSIKGSQKVHNSANKIIKLKNGSLCSCGNDYTIKFWKKNNISKKHENYKILKCKAEYVNSVLEVENDKLVAGGLWYIQFFNIKTFKAETDIENINTHSPNSMIRIGGKLICSDYKIYFIDIKTQQLIKTIQIQYDSEEGIYCLCPFRDNLFICGGNLRTIDIYDAENYEKIASRSVKDEFIFDIKRFEKCFLFCGSKNIFAYFFNDFRDKIDKSVESEINESKLKIVNETSSKLSPSLNEK